MILLSWYYLIYKLYQQKKKQTKNRTQSRFVEIRFIVRGCLQFGLSMNSNEGVLISVANFEVSMAITANVDLLPSAPVSFFLARNYVTVGTTGHAGVQGHVQVPDGEERVHVVIKSPSMSQRKCPRKRFTFVCSCHICLIWVLLDISG